MHSHATTTHLPAATFTYPAAPLLDEEFDPFDVSDIVRGELSDTIRDCAELFPGAE